MQSFYYEHPLENVHSIRIYYSDKTHKALKEFLTFTLSPKECNRILNNIILGELAYEQGDLTIIKRQNEIVNIKESLYHWRIVIKKRVMDKNDYLEYYFKYNFRSNKYEFKVIRNERGIISNVTDNFEASKEIYELIHETDVLRHYPDINVSDDELCIINGRKGILEISDEEISLYSPEQKDKDVNNLELQRYTIIKNDTKEEVGYVTFNFKETNIAYRIYEPYQGHHYASKALKLMIELIKNNVNFQRDNLYVRIDEKNLASIKTAESCDLLRVGNFGPIQKYVVNPQKILTVK